MRPDALEFLDLRIERIVFGIGVEAKPLGKFGGREGGARNRQCLEYRFSASWWSFGTHFFFLPAVVGGPATGSFDIKRLAVRI
jgi:hypothetical protein